jgi:Type II secretion system (T2SS), protein M subtype b
MIGLGTALGRVAAIAVMLAMLAPFPLAGFWALAVYRDGETERQELLERFDKFRGIAAYRASLGSKDTATDVTPFLLGKGTAAILSAGLQSRLRELAARHHVEILQMSDLKPDRAAEMTAVGIRIELAGPPQGVHAVFAAIDLAVPWLFTGNVNLRSGYADGTNTPEEPPLTAALDVSGLANLQSGEGQP